VVEREGGAEAGAALGFAQVSPARGATQANRGLTMIPLALC
jgi:hypothetical protein